MKSLVFGAVLAFGIVALGSAQTGAPQTGATQTGLPLLAVAFSTNGSKDADGTHLVGNVQISTRGSGQVIVAITADEADLVSAGREVVLRGNVRIKLDPKTLTFTRALPY